MMRVAVVYESLFGNTREVAAAIAEGVLAVDPRSLLEFRPVAEAGPPAAGVDLLVVGGPTHFLGMTSERSRRLQRQWRDRDVRLGLGQARQRAPAGMGVREWLEALPQAGSNRWAAAFDTRLGSLFPGSAARLIARGLRAHGYQIAARPEGFLVEAVEGPLRAGERDRAVAWGSALASGLRDLACGTGVGGTGAGGPSDLAPGGLP